MFIESASWNQQSVLVDALDPLEISLSPRSIPILAALLAQKISEAALADSVETLICNTCTLQLNFLASITVTTLEVKNGLRKAGGH